jgi:hypothetical protein
MADAVMKLVALATRLVSLLVTVWLAEAGTTTRCGELKAALVAT